MALPERVELEMDRRPGFDPYVGTQIAGYTLEALVGRGGMSVVYRAEQRQLGRKVALKLLTPDLARDERFRQRFVRESRLAAGLDHPNIIPIYDAGEAEGLLYIAMRFVDGCTLAELIDRRGPLSTDLTLSIVQQIAAALDVAHSAGLVHRDVKPENILITERAGELDRIFLSDFGLTKRPNVPGTTRSGELMGTVGYVAPEQIEGKPLDRRSDVYSLGCLLYHCLTNHRPFEAETDVGILWAHLNDQVPSVTQQGRPLPEAMDQVMETALAKDPRDRYDSAGALAEAVQRALDIGQDAGSRLSEQKTNQTAIQHVLTPARTEVRRSRIRMIGIAGVFLLVLAAAAVLIGTRGNREPSGPRRSDGTSSQTSQVAKQQSRSLGQRLPTAAINRSGTSSQFKNPIVRYNAPDPAIMGAGGQFYAYTTQSTYKHLIHMPILVSDNAIEWRFIGDALPDLPPWADTTDPDTWGPDIIRIGDSYHIYFAERMNATGAMAIALATSRRPEGPFHVRGGPLLGAAGYVHPFVFREPSGRLLMYVSSPRGPIQAQRLSRDGRTLLGSPQPVLTTSDVTTYETRIEGPAVVRHRGYYFLFYSGNRCCGRRAHYAELVARSRSPFGPFERAPTNPIVAGNEYFEAPGHGSVLRDSSSAYFLLYHAMEQSNPLNSRSLMLDRIRWKGGWPIVNGGSGPSRGPQSRPKVEH